MKVYKGKCASCGCTNQSSNFKKYPKGCAIPQKFSLPLPNRSEANHRICHFCSVKHYKRFRSKAKNFKKRSPTIRRFPSRKEFNLTTPTEALPDRSAAVKYQLIAMSASLPPDISVSMPNFLTILLNSRCQCRRRNGEECEGKFQLRGTKTNGRQTKIQLVCRDCLTITEYCSQQDNGRIQLRHGDQSSRFFKADVRQVLLVLLAGSTYTVYETMNAANPKRMSKTTFYRIQELLCSGIVSCCKQVLTEYRNELAARLGSSGMIWAAQLNGAWSHRGWKARHHSFIIRNVEDDKVVCAVVLTKKHVGLVTGSDGSKVEKELHLGNYFGTSKGMEGEAFILALEELREANLLSSLKILVADGDSGVPSILRKTPGCSHIEVAHDPGHQQKNFMRSLKGVFGVGKYKGFPYRIGKFYMRCLKKAEKKFHGYEQEVVDKRKEYFDTLWQHVDGHYTRRECPSDCPCNEFYGNALDLLEGQDIQRGEALTALLMLGETEELNTRIQVEPTDANIVKEILEEDAGMLDRENRGVKVRKMPKRWLDESNKKEAAMIEKMKRLTKLAGECASDVLFGLNTCMSECSNIRRLVFCRKDRFYYQSYEARSMISAVLENLKRTELYQQLFSYFGIEYDGNDENVLATLNQQDDTKLKHSTRKRSRSFIDRSSEISKNNIKLGSESRAVSKARTYARKYTEIHNKKLRPGGAFSRRKGQQSQVALEERHQKGDVLVKQCEECKGYYLKTHNRCLKRRKIPQKPSVTPE